MSRKNIIMVVGVVAVISIAILIHYMNQPPTFTVLSYDVFGGTATFQFGTVMGNTSTDGSWTAGGAWTATNTGNIVNIYQNGNLYRTITITGTGIVPI